MKLDELIKEIDVIGLIGSTDINVQSLSQDSREIDGGDVCYFAVPGTVVDGHDYIEEAINNGATSIICEHVPQIQYEYVTYVVVRNITKILGVLASVFYDHPSSKITVIAVTGTNGKTSVASFISQSLVLLNKKTLLLSTAGDYFNHQKIDIIRKAPSSLEIIELHKILAYYVEQGLQYCCLEATSIGLDQDRLSGVAIDVALFTNLADDHLDYHGDVNIYAQAKKKLFDSLPIDSLAVTNGDDDYGKYMVSETHARSVQIGTKESNYQFIIQKSDLSGLFMVINDQSLHVPVVGNFNAYNIALSFATLIELGFDTESVVNTLSKITGVPGRMQSIPNNKDVLALVDYAHSSDALVNVLNTLQNISHNRIITVVGCGGDRDRTKRAPMAKVTQNMSTIAIYTADNPSTEGLSQIFDDMKKGVDITNQNFYFITSREEAIEYAISISEKNDIILVAGKGHEDYQIVGTEKRYFDDREILKKYLAH